MEAVAIHKKAQNDLLLDNEISTRDWAKFKDDLECTKSVLKWLPDKTSHNVLIPFGPKAFMRGKIVHTNELLVNLGEGYLVKRSAKEASEICQRKIDSAEEILGRLEKERNLITDWQKFPEEVEVFGSDSRPEIIEHVTEEEEEQWRKLHRQREKDYRGRLKEIKETQQGNMKAEEEALWRRLDELELEEELEDELNRLHEESESEEELEQVKKRVSFTIEKEPETLQLLFHHSEEKPVLTNWEPGKINTPGDIYKQYMESFRPKSIMKVQENPNWREEQKTITNNVEKEKEKEEEEEEGKEKIQRKVVVWRRTEIPDVVERSEGSSLGLVTVNEKRGKVSKFKASRMNR